MTTPAGWYDDGSGTQRYWDGEQWTEHTNVPAAAAQIPVMGASRPNASRKKLLIAGGVAAVVLAGGGTALALTLGGSSSSGHGDPALAVRTFMQATTCHDLQSDVSAAMWSADASGCLDSEVAGTTGGRESQAVELIETSGDTARVAVYSSSDAPPHCLKESEVASIQGDGGSVCDHGHIVNLVKEGGQWKVDHFGDDPSDH